MEDISTERIRFITRTAMLLALTLAIQMMGLPQQFTGPAINAMLVISAVFVGPLGGTAIGFLTPWIAFLVGILPAPLAPAIPFIMLGNASLVILFYFIRKALKESLPGEVIGIIFGAIVKFLILTLVVRYIIEVPPPIALMLQVPQLVTALTGGGFALVIVHALKKILKD